MSIKVLSLFSNVGIGETYLHKNNILVKVANDICTDRCILYKHLYPQTEVVCGDITKENVYKEIILKAKSNNCNFILATPPCQGMSIAGKLSQNDPRNMLITKVVDSINDLNPDYVLIENVPKMLKQEIEVSNQPIQILDYIKKSIDSNYVIQSKVLDTADFEIPQTRKRAIILIHKHSVKPLVFPKTGGKKITVKDSIGHLPSLESGQDSEVKWHKAKVHNKNHILWMKHTPSGKSAYENYDNDINEFYPKKDNGKVISGFRTCYKRISWDKPCPTITMCNGAISSQNNVHPGRLLLDGTYSDARVLTLLELFLLTGLPENWNIPDDINENFLRKVIGECVPPKLILELTKCLK